MADYLRQLKALLPPGVVFDREPDSVVTQTLEATADELARVGARGVDLIEESDPRTADETIGDWERILSLPDESVLAIPATLAERRIAVAQKYASRGGQNREFFIALAAACGYELADVTLAIPTFGDVNVSHLSDVGGSLAGGVTYHYKLTALNAFGETLVSSEGQIAVPGATNTNRVEISGVQPVEGATLYRLYGRTSGNFRLIYEDASPAFIDDGSVTPVVSPPAEDTANFLAIRRYVPDILRAGFRVGDRVYGAEYAYAMELNVQPPVGTVLAQADFERVIRHATHSHIQVVFTYR